MTNPTPLGWGLAWRTDSALAIHFISAPILSRTHIKFSEKRFYKTSLFLQTASQQTAAMATAKPRTFYRETMQWKSLQRLCPCKKRYQYYTSEKCVQKPSDSRQYPSNRYPNLSFFYADTLQSHPSNQCFFLWKAVIWRRDWVILWRKSVP